MGKDGEREEEGDERDGNCRKSVWLRGKGEGFAEGEEGRALLPSHVSNGAGFRFSDCEVHQPSVHRNAT